MTLIYIVGGPVVLALLMLRAGGFWRFWVRTFAVMAALCMALSAFSRNMDHATELWLGMLGEAVRKAWRDVWVNRRDALAEMGEKG